MMSRLSSNAHLGDASAGALHLRGGALPLCTAREPEAERAGHANAGTEYHPEDNPMHVSRILLVSLPLLFTSPGVLAAGGVPSPARTDSAAQAYEAGLADRDRAEKLSERAAGAGTAQPRLEARVQAAWERAVGHYQEAIEKDSEMHEAYASLGYALRKLGDYEASLAAYDRALSIAPDYPEALEYRGEAYLAVGRLEDAKAAYSTLEQAHPEYADQLLVAMRIWVTEQRAGTEGRLSADVSAFADWVGERVARAEGQARSGASLQTRW
jgi:tetratricopeptide (TPR) repeat protein